MKKLNYFFLSNLMLTLVACETRDTTATVRKPSTITTPTPDVDNTSRNVRDRENTAVTPLQQGENDADRAITQEIRRWVINENSLSNNAKNSKIITLSGVVTLRGVVDNGQEKDAIARKANGVPGVKRVDNQLEIKATR